MRCESSENPIAIEIKQEMAASYFVACKKMVAAIEALQTFDRANGSGGEESGRKRRRSELLEAAAERVFFVIIQREAMKLSWSEKFFEDYEVPDEVRKRLGPRNMSYKVK